MGMIWPLGYSLPKSEKDGWFKPNYINNHVKNKQSKHPQLKGRDSRILLSNKKEWALKHVTWWKKTISKDYILYYSIYITSLKWQNYRDGEQISGCQGVSKDERRGVAGAINGYH